MYKGTMVKDTLKPCWLSKTMPWHANRACMSCATRFPACTSKHPGKPPSQQKALQPSASCPTCPAGAVVATIGCSATLKDNAQLMQGWSYGPGSICSCSWIYLLMHWHTAGCAAQIRPLAFCTHRGWSCCGCPFVCRRAWGGAGALESALGPEPAPGVHSPSDIPGSLNRQVREGGFMLVPF